MSLLLNLYGDTRLQATHSCSESPSKKELLKISVQLHNKYPSEYSTLSILQVQVLCNNAGTVLLLPSSGRVPVCTWRCELDRLMGPQADITVEDKALFLAYACSELPHNSLQRYPSASHQGNLSFRNPPWHLIQWGSRKTWPMCGRPGYFQQNLMFGF